VLGIVDDHHAGQGSHSVDQLKKRHHTVKCPRRRVGGDDHLGAIVVEHLQQVSLVADRGWQRPPPPQESLLHMRVLGRIADQYPPRGWIRSAAVDDFEHQRRDGVGLVVEPLTGEGVRGVRGVKHDRPRPVQGQCEALFLHVLGLWQQNILDRAAGPRRICSLDRERRSCGQQH